MAADLVDQLRTSLAATYSIVRELGGGGMSRVFLANDIALGRPVVIKVLLPELAAGVNAERFDREVLLSARLQHPHIVPVLTAGEVGGLPYYVMPYVKGESLRARLAGGPLPVPETISILSDVAKALAFAQSEQVVHRDIKPDNILLSGGAATVADFGIAKAISTARQGDGGATLTSMGTSLGTPAYMAPEQVAGDPDVDHRADIYALGCVAYEMLTGSAPFAGKSPQQMLAAHVMETPPALAERREGLPASLVQLVNQCMAKEPGARPQSASELVSRLEHSDSHQSIRVEQSSGERRVVPGAMGKWLVAIAVFAVAAIPVYRMTRKAPVVGNSLTFAVAPFQVLDPQLALWKEGIVDVLSRNLDGAGLLRAVAPSASIKRWEGHGDRTSAMKFGKALGARLVMYGELQSAGSGMVKAKAFLVDTVGSATPLEEEVTDSSARMDRVIDSLSVKLLARIGRDHSIGAGRIASLGSGSLPAIKAFLQGSQFYRRTQWDSAAAYFSEAVRIDSTFGVAYLQLGQSLGWSNGANNPEANAANRRAATLIRPGLSTRDSMLLTAIGHYARSGSGGVRNFAEARKAINTAELGTERYPNDAELWYLLGDLRFHIDPHVTRSEVMGDFDRAIAADSDFAPAYVHAIEQAFRNGPEAGKRYVNAYLKREPRDAEGEGIRLAAFVTTPGAKLKDIRSRLDSTSYDAGRKATTALARIPDSMEVVLGLLRGGVQYAPNAGSRRAATDLLTSHLAMRGHISEAWALAVRNKRPDAGEIAALGLVPVDSALKLLRPWLNDRSESYAVPFAVLALARDSVTLSNQVTVMQQAVKTNPNIAQRGVIDYVIASLQAWTALAKGDTASASSLFEALPDTVISFPVDVFMRARLLAKKDPQRALALLERMQAADLLYAARELERGRIAESIGDRDRAVDAFAYVEAVWQNTDSPLLRDAVKEAKAALARLDSDSRIRTALATGARR